MAQPRFSGCKRRLARDRHSSDQAARNTPCWLPTAHTKSVVLRCSEIKPVEFENVNLYDFFFNVWTLQ